MGATKRESPEAAAAPPGELPAAASNASTTGTGNTVSTTLSGADPWSRIAATGRSSGTTPGRGSLAGWTRCPLCAEVSKKQYALGRGIATHLREVHTPWRPGKLAQKVHRRNYERRERERRRKHQQQQNDQEQQLPPPQHRPGKRKRSSGPGDGEGTGTYATEPAGGSDRATGFEPLPTWTPTEEEKRAWAARIVELLRAIEAREGAAQGESGPAAGQPPKGTDKTGKAVVSYRDSLPPFLAAASRGDLAGLKALVRVARERDETIEPIGPGEGGREIPGNGGGNGGSGDGHLRSLLRTRDRHNSTADHWAAGGGHLSCLRYLYDLREGLGAADPSPDRARRRRDGKTCLHYAARNGHVPCLSYLLGPAAAGGGPAPGNGGGGHRPLHAVDERSGEGTTPLHLACYGGHPEAVAFLVEKHGADPLARNDWGCTCAHWAAMTLSDSEDSVRALCTYLSDRCGVSFCEKQGQGHTALHKAAHRGNKHVVEWMAGRLGEADRERAGSPDDGGHRPSDIWAATGRDPSFAEWMRTLGW
ncbi:unnamed protein product [Pseudo-nitzschia multistriata]|uniref:Uncharacterized protein n=1 Tax=Pseudo-nitzschia multistriata TaxID=183589 RepID=A0A448ZA32_9STRA|nr:unnamed protein product [Pseudo-nitzschia multistriata]